jgi:hypothetical protein
LIIESDFDFGEKMGLELCGLQHGKLLHQYGDVHYTVHLETQFADSGNVCGTICVGTIVINKLREANGEQLFEVAPQRSVYGEHGYLEFERVVVRQSEFIRPCIVVDRLAINEKYRGSGFFREGIRALEEHAQYNGLGMLVRDVFNENLRASLLRHDYVLLGSHDYLKTWADF